GGIELTTPDDLALDSVGMSTGSAYKEGTTLAPLASDTNHSYERKPGGLQGSTQDTDDNNNDFQLITSDPQNLSSGPTPGSTPTPTPTPTTTPTPSATPTPTPNSLVVISQIFGGGGNSGAPYKNDLIELFNRGTTTA